jgi:hypothetical protein
MKSLLGTVKQAAEQKTRDAGCEMRLFVPRSHGEE